MSLILRACSICLGRAHILYMQEGRARTWLTEMHKHNRAYDSIIIEGERERKKGEKGGISKGAIVIDVSLMIFNTSRDTKS